MTEKPPRTVRIATELPCMSMQCGSHIRTDPGPWMPAYCWRICQKRRDFYRLSWMALRVLEFGMNLLNHIMDMCSAQVILEWVWIQ